MVNVKISSFNEEGGGGVDVIGELSVTPAAFFPVNFIDPRLVTRWPICLLIANAC